MAEPEKSLLENLLTGPIGWSKAFGQLQQQTGPGGAVVLIALIGIILIWFNWKKAKDVPGVEWLVKRIWPDPIPTPPPLPVAPEGRLTIAVASLAKDKDCESKDFLLSELRGYDGVEIQNLNASIELVDAHQEVARKNGEDSARALLKKTGADVLIWGLVVRVDGRSKLELFWTPAHELSGAKATEKYLPTETIALPAEFWDDLKQILGLLIQYRLLKLHLDQPGHYIAEKLAPMIDQVRALIENRKGEWKQETLVGVQFSLAVALCTVGEQSGKSEALMESAELYGKVLEVYTRASVPLGWAMMQDKLGNTLAALGELESAPTRLKEAAKAFRAAAEEWTNHGVTLELARTQNNLGKALVSLGERGNDMEPLAEAVTVLLAALELRTRESAPMQWAMTQLNLGNAWKAYGDLEDNTKLTGRAVTAYREALKENTRARVPLEWAKTQNSLGNALRAIGEREKNSDRLREAVGAYREALKEFANVDSVVWAMAQANLGGVLTALFELDPNNLFLNEAVIACEAALRVYNLEQTPNPWAVVQNNLGNACYLLGRRDDGIANLQKAIEAYDKALKVRTRGSAARKWADTTCNKAICLQMIAERLGDFELAKEAAANLEEALGVAIQSGHEHSQMFLATLLNGHALIERLGAR